MKTLKTITWLVIVIVLIGAALWFMLGGGLRQEDYDRIYKKARIFEKQGRIETAIAAYEIILKNYSHSPRAAHAKFKLQELIKKRKYYNIRESGKCFYIQTAAFKDPERAKSYLRTIKVQLPYLSFRIYKTSRFYKLVSRRLNSYNQAKRFLKEMKTLEYEGFIRSSLN